ncbi:tRNA 2-selenouridine(34) synthase MnmH [Parashewanella spongiae]|uniref:tRNA 2-selenouridine synthase n=1 Tax=Parashewanella spongiae TaxID=342950 RepID=A0A3A6UM85_9GAMM|nr:tRNA 2-selenouridine(34) synthase MnmH [Parashewanella spongiae]RJY18814.1 tRNA 2-selenouridine(34) synthase MnmH [Parashewanella spongiae]
MAFNTVTSSAYRDIFINDHPIMDVRAPIEFNKGAFANAINVPLMTDAERQQVGSCYKQQGQQAAISLGHELVSGEIKQQRLSAWQQFNQRHPQGYLYCFRGGLRSQVTQTWLQEVDVDIPFIEGGYKSMRQFLISTIEQASTFPMKIIAGSTGCGKTEYIKSQHNAIDLEGIANHRGSSFGNNITPQPTQINFENQLAIALLKHQAAGHKTLVLEDESFMIGRNAIPKCFYNAMKQAPIHVLTCSFDDRLQRILNDYVVDMLSQFIEKYGQEDGFAAFSQYLISSIDKIKKRLGGKQHQQIQTIMTQALKEQQNRNSVALHLEWIQLLLELYYDPMYKYQLKKRSLE